MVPTADQTGEMGAGGRQEHAAAALAVPPVMRHQKDSALLRLPLLKTVTFPLSVTFKILLCFLIGFHVGAGAVTFHVPGSRHTLSHLTLTKALSI